MNFKPFEWISKFTGQLNLGGTMSKLGADRAGKDISFGIKFFLCCSGLGVLMFLVFAGLYFIKWW